MFKLTSIKYQLILFLISFGLYLSFLDRDILFFRSVLIALIVSIAAETFFVYLKEHKFLITESSIVSGLIISLVLASDSKWWVLSAASLLAIGSKNLIRFKRKHIFNPAAFGIFLSIIFFGAATEWKGTYLYYVLVPFGFYFIAKIRRFEVLAAYLVATFGLFGIQAFIQRQPFGQIFGLLSYFYIFIMLIEPKTTPAKPASKIIFGALAAVLIFIFSIIGVTFDAELAALLIANLSVPLLSKVL